MIDEIKHFELALQHGNSQKVRDILSKNSKGYNSLLFKETNALVIACGNGFVECARILIEYGAKVNLDKHQEISSLHSACQAGQLECAQLLIDHGALVDERTRDFDGCSTEHRTPLHLACDPDPGAHTESCIRLLVKHRANVNAQDASGKTPLHHAYNKPKILKVLLELGANTHIQDKDGKTPLDLAQDSRYRRPNPESIRLLQTYSK